MLEPKHDIQLGIEIPKFSFWLCKLRSLVTFQRPQIIPRDFSL